MGVPNQFIAKTVIESARVNQNFAVACFSGEVRMYGSDVAPSGWLLCDGASYLRLEYPDLFAVIGVSFGSADGSHFNVPNINGRVVVGKDSSDATFQNIGNSGGSKTHTLTTAEIPSHYHSVDPPNTISGGHTADHSHWYHLGDPNKASSTDNTGTAFGNAWGQNTAGASNSHQHWLDIGIFNSGNTGSGGAHNNLQPYLVLNYIIKT